MGAGPAEIQAVAALTLVLAAAVISTTRDRSAFSKPQVTLLETAPDTATTGYNPTGVALPP